MIFEKESTFEEALIERLTKSGWESSILKYPTEQDLIDNWASILFENNRGIDRLNDYPLTDGEMQQIIEQIEELKTPVKLNGLINGRTLSITRDNPNDKAHFGKEVSLFIYDRKDIAAGRSRYQIVQQPKFKSKSKVLNDRRGDLMLLINGMPLFHIELKKSGVPVSQASHQIEKYAHEGIFTGLFSLIQIFVAMNPDETLYFANPGPEGSFNPNFYFHWADFNNEPINDWAQIASSLLSIPMAHQLIGFYTVADNSDGVLKVMRSYQFFAASRISDRVSKTDWASGNQRGGYIWHTTGSGKTMTSFKSAQLIASSKDADKVVFLTDRIELGTQSLNEYRGFADDHETVQETEDTMVLISKLKSDSAKDTLIVTSIQKMSNIKNDAAQLKGNDLAIMQGKRIVYIIDEAHRSTFGDMLMTIKRTFPHALFFGFTGTPIHEENQKKMSTTSTIFGNELHRYSIADGIRDGNVLGFDPYMVQTYKEKDLRKAVGLMRAKADSDAEAMADEKKKAVYLNYLNDVPMAGVDTDDGRRLMGVEDFLPPTQYDRDEHRTAVVDDIAENWYVYSQGKYHGILATSSIPEAVKYYRLFKERVPWLKTTGLFDPSIDNDGQRSLDKEDGLVEMLEDYNAMYGMDFSLKTYASFKKDVANRLAHKGVYKRVENEPDKQLDLLIVVNQMLTGFDSKWLNTLYLDKMMEYENLIQAFSRTNRVFTNDKRHGIIRYYRKPFTMKQNIENAVELYSGNKPIGIFVEKLDYNLRKMNECFQDIERIFQYAGVHNMETLPGDKESKAKFAKLFKELNQYLDAAKVQGFHWDKLEYDFADQDDKNKKNVITMAFDEQLYLVLAQRYKELFIPVGEGDGGETIPYEIDSYLTEIRTDRIDSDYMNLRFKKYLKLLTSGDVGKDELEETLEELHKSFASLSQEEQKYANIFLHDVDAGEAKLEEGKTFREYITSYMAKAKNDQISMLVNYLGLDEQKLRTLMAAGVNEDNLNEFSRFDDLKATVDRAKAREYFEKVEGVKLVPFKVNIKVDKLLRDFVLSGGKEIPSIE